MTDDSHLEEEGLPLTDREEAEVAGLARLLCRPSFDLPAHRLAALRAEVLEHAAREQEASERTDKTGPQSPWRWWTWALPALAAAGTLLLTLQATRPDAEGAAATSRAEPAAAHERFAAESDSNEVDASSPPPRSDAASALLAAQAVVLRARLQARADADGPAPLAERVEHRSSERQLQAALTSYRAQLLAQWESPR